MINARGSLIASALCICVALSWTGRYCKAADDTDNVRFVLAGVRNSREKLRSGRFTAEGHVVRYGGQMQTYQGDVHIAFAFDVDKELIRCDIDEPMRTGDANSEETSVISVKQKFARSVDRTVWWDDAFGRQKIGFVMVHPVDWLPGSRRPVFDIRNCGMNGWAAIDGNEKFDLVMTRLEGYRIIEHSKGTDGVDVITLEHGPNNDMRTSLYVRTDKDFTVEKEEFRGLYIATGQWSEVMASTEVTWTKEGDVFVPASVHLSRRFNGDETYDLAFSWSEVNQPISTNIVDPWRFDVAEGSPIIDMRLGGKGVVLGRVGSEPGRGPAAPSLDAGQTRKTGGGGYPVFVWVNVVIGLAVLAWLTLRAKARRAP